jgi:hypothetical protein
MEDTGMNAHEDLLKEMESDKWYIKLHRWIKLQIWLFKCYLRKKP